jgi:hypothetical protein
MVIVKKNHKNHKIKKTTHNPKQNPKNFNLRNPLISIDDINAEKNYHYPSGGNQDTTISNDHLSQSKLEVDKLEIGAQVSQVQDFNLLSPKVFSTQDKLEPKELLHKKIRTDDDLFLQTKIDLLSKQDLADKQIASKSKQEEPQKANKKPSLAQRVFDVVTNRYVDIGVSLATAGIALALVTNPVGIAIAYVGLAYATAKMVAKLPVFKKFASTKWMQKMLDSPIGRAARSKLVKIPLNVVQKSLTFMSNPIGNGIAILAKFSGAGVDYKKNSTFAERETQIKLLEEIKNAREKTNKYVERLNDLDKQLILPKAVEKKDIKAKNTKFNASKVVAQTIMEVGLSSVLGEAVESVKKLVEEEGRDNALVAATNSMSLESDATISIGRISKWAENEALRVKKNKLINELGVDYKDTKDLASLAKGEIANYNALKSAKTQKSVASAYFAPHSQEQVKSQKVSELKSTLDDATKEEADKIIINLKHLSKRNLLKQTFARQKNPVEKVIHYKA